MICENQNRLVLQFHITGRCNLRCKHCYRTEGDAEKLSYDDVVNVIDGFRELRRTYNAAKGIKKRGHINLTGGEPFIREDIAKIIAYIDSHNSELTYAVLSNGSFIDEAMTELLKQTKVSFVQLSIDGDRKRHDALRATGDYDRVFATARQLERAGIRTYISFTANKENYRCIPKVARKCRRSGITRLWSDRLVPIGTGEHLRDVVITDAELPNYIRVLQKAQGTRLSRKLYPKTQVTMNRALQFQDSGGAIYSCSAGESLITVDEFGQVMPCRRMPIVCGDVFTQSLEDIYYGNPVFRELRERKSPDECRNCMFSRLCGGGAKCQSHAMYGTYRKADYACPLRNKYCEE